MKLRNIFRLSLLLLVLWILLSLSVYAFQRFLIFQGVRLPANHRYQFDFPFEEHFLLTPDSISLNGLYFPTPKNRKGTILYFHGNADHLQRWGQYSPDLTRRGYDVWMFDYRGYGKSKGKPEEEAYYRDARFIYDWLLQKHPADSLLLYGRSLGTSIASQLATQVEARLLILETPFDHIQHAIEWSIPVLWLPWPLRYQFANDRHLPLIDFPVYIFHGTKDEVVPYRSAEALKPLLKPTDRFFTIEGGKHKDLGTFPVFQQRLDEIL